MALGPETRAGIGGGGKLYKELGQEEDGAPTNKLLKDTADTKADLTNGRLRAQQFPNRGFGIGFDTATNTVFYNGDRPLSFASPVRVSPGFRVNPATGAYVEDANYTTYGLVKTASGVAYRANVSIFYGAFYQEDKYLGPWSADINGAPKQSPDSSVYTKNANTVVQLYLNVSVPNSQINSLRIVPIGGAVYDDRDVKARLAALEALGGRFRGPWTNAAAIAFVQYDTTLQDKLLYYANATFTQAAGEAFDSAKWTALPGGSATPGAARDPYDVPTDKALQVIADYASAGGPITETDTSYYGKEFTDDHTSPGDEFLYACKPRRPVTTGDPTVWKWGRYLEAGV
jgi:hypothetical protein